MTSEGWLIGAKEKVGLIAGCGLAEYPPFISLHAFLKRWSHELSRSISATSPSYINESPWSADMPLNIHELWASFNVDIESGQMAMAET